MQHPTPALQTDASGLWMAGWQLTLLAEGAALLAGFQMMMFYELQLAPVDEHLYQVAQPPHAPETCIMRQVRAGCLL